MVSRGNPSPSVPITIAKRGSAFKTSSSSDTDLSLSAIATVLNPCSRKLSTGFSTHVHGTRNTDPFETLTARRFNGSQVPCVNSTPSIPSAAAARNIAPIFVVSTTESITTTREAPSQTLATVGISLRRIAQSTPRVSV